MKRWCIHVGCLLVWASLGFGQDVAVEKVVISSSFKGKVPLSICHLFGQKLKPPFSTNSYELAEITLVNHATDARTVTLTLELVGLGQPLVKTIKLAAFDKKTVDASPIIDPKLVQDIIDERVGKLRVEVEQDGKKVYADTKDVTLLGRDEVPFVGYTSKGQRVPSRFFWVTRVQPKSRLVDAVLSAASQREGFEFKKGLSGYQGKLDAQQMVVDLRKIYKTIQALGFTYLNTPVSFDDDFQRVKTANEALATKSGNCIDGTCVFASCISAIGYDAIIAMPPGHAFVIAAMPPPDNNQSAKNRLAIFAPSKLAPSAMLATVYPNYIPIETTVLQAQAGYGGLTRTTFEQAVKIAQNELAQDKQISFIDVRAWRSAGLIPFPEE